MREFAVVRIQGLGWDISAERFARDRDLGRDADVGVPSVVLSTQYR